jgi:pimeloyl-ACP methyl ester carboxylesterase
MNGPGGADIRERDLPSPDGRQLHIYECGDPYGELVVYHHGTPGSGRPERRWAEDAAVRGIRLVGYDRPGYGGSTRHAGRSVADAATDITTIADALGVTRLRTWGASGGGPHALACAALRPDRIIAAASVASPAPFRAAGLDWLAGMGEDNIAEFAVAVAGEPDLRRFLTTAREELMAVGPDGLADAMRSLLPDVDLEALDARLTSYMYDGFAVGLRHGIDGWLDDDLAFVRAWGFEPDRIGVPVLVVQGAHDLMVPFGHGKWLAATIPACTVRLSETDGHLSLIRAIDQVHGWLMAQRA